jgi:hypothetical protein
VARLGEGLPEILICVGAGARLLSPLPDKTIRRHLDKVYNTLGYQQLTIIGAVFA